MEGTGKRLKYSQVGDFTKFVRYMTVYILDYRKLSPHFQ